MSDFIDYVTLMLLNVISALVILAFFLWWGLGQADRRSWAPAFGIAGLVATVSGFAMTFTWPIPEPYSMVYGEMSVLLGVLFLGAAWTLARGWSLLPLSIYAFFCGAAAVMIGMRIIHLSLTGSPGLAGAGFILTGLGGVFAGAVLGKQDRRSLRIVGGLVMLAATAIWVSIAYMAYWQHLQVQPPVNGATSAEARGDASEPDGTAAVLPMLRLPIPSREDSRPVRVRSVPAIAQTSPSQAGCFAWHDPGMPVTTRFTSQAPPGTT